MGTPGPTGHGERSCIFRFSSYCGAFVCVDCGRHRKLVRCYCGWAASGGDGRAELIAFGETIEPEE
jgi:hypothetical protein